MTTKNRNDIFTIVASVICFFIFLLLINVLSVPILANMSSIFFRMVFVSTSSMSLMDSIGVIISMITSIFIALVFLTLGLAFLSAYGFKKENRRVSLVPAVIAIIMTLFFIGFSIMSLFISLSLLVMCYLILPFANTFGKELKRWVFFRVGSHSISKALMIFNILVVIGLFVSVQTDITFYQTQFKDQITETIQSMISVPLAQEQMDELIFETVEQSTLFQTYLKWLPILVAFSTWVILEFLRSLILSNIGGVFTSVLLRTRK